MRSWVRFLLPTSISWGHPHGFGRTCPRCVVCEVLRATEGSLSDLTVIPFSIGGRKKKKLYCYKFFLDNEGVLPSNPIDYLRRHAIPHKPRIAGKSDRSRVGGPKKLMLAAGIELRTSCFIGTYSQSSHHQTNPLSWFVSHMKKQN